MTTTRKESPWEARRVATQHGEQMLLEVGLRCQAVSMAGNHVGLFHDFSIWFIWFIWFVLWNFPCSMIFSIDDQYDQQKLNQKFKP